jgi:hypothetical protein
LALRCTRVGMSLQHQGVNPRTTRRSRLRDLLIFACLFTFAVQSLVTVAHFHAVATTAVSPGAIGDTSSIVQGIGIPGDPDDALHCPFCQSILLAGAVVPNAPLILSISGLTRGFIAPLPKPVRLRSRRPNGALHNRGPPHA